MVKAVGREREKLSVLFVKPKRKTKENKETCHLGLFCHPNQTRIKTPNILRFLHSIEASNQMIAHLLAILSFSASHA